MFVRLLALLVALGFLAGPVHAGDAGALPESALVDEIDDVPDLEMTVLTLAPATPTRVPASLAHSALQPPLHRYSLLVFRPPRALTFG